MKELENENALLREKIESLYNSSVSLLVFFMLYFFLLFVFSSILTLAGASNLTKISISMKARSSRLFLTSVATVVQLCLIICYFL